MSGGFPAFGKIARWNREVVITEKIDGTNGVVAVMDPEDEYRYLELGGPPVIHAGGYQIAAGSRSRWIYPGKATDNHGFAAWVYENAEELARLGAGVHYGEWYGQGIQRGYGLGEKRWMLFNNVRWSDPDVRPKVAEVSTVLWRGPGNDVTHGVHSVLTRLRETGSEHVPGFMQPEGMVLYHRAGNSVFKMTLDNDDSPKSM